MSQNKIRNIAIIAHVDHGKTTLVDQLFRQSGVFRENEMVAERIMDSMDLERERGITITAKNCAIRYKDSKINIIDTPGHADFGGEVERSLKMVDGVILLVDAAEGPLPQTRFVLQKALSDKLPVIVLINKIDRKDARPAEVLHDIYSLFIDLGADDHQINFPVLYTIGRDGIAKKSLDGKETTLEPLFEAILHYIPPPAGNENNPFQMLVCNLGYSDYLGRLAIGRVFNGKTRKGNQLVCVKEGNEVVPLKITKLQTYEGIRFVETNEVTTGEILVLSGVDEVQIGDTLCEALNPIALPRVKVDEPTVMMRFMPNTSPLVGQDGKLVQSRRIFDRLQKETLYNVAVQVEADPTGESFIVKGRGEFQLAVLIETMRREGFEMCVGRPQIIFKTDGGKRLEPIEHVVIECLNEHTGVVTEKLSSRKGRMLNMHPFGSDRMRLEFSVPSRGLIGYRNEFLTDTKGTGILTAYLLGYEEYRGDISSRQSGSLVADRIGEAVAYGLYYLEARGRLFVTPGTKLYEGMIVGEHSRDNDLNVNACRAKKLSNMRAASKDENVVLISIVPMTLEKAIEFIKDDEWVEVTPLNIRLRKSILPANQRKASRDLD